MSRRMRKVAIGILLLAIWDYVWFTSVTAPLILTGLALVLEVASLIVEEEKR